ncbi:uncharacterized protein LOC143922454 [Arctopsyche grandis]|uniref:uncharacterized protein LOC143922454 n=1 Tax=Arctopsyche grandis TaxID=121162 RepID=UPI00406D9CC5
MSDNKNRLSSIDPDESFASIYSDVSGLVDNDCSNSWLNYLQTLNGLCAASARLAGSLRRLPTKLGNDLYNVESPGIKDWETITHALFESTVAVHTQTLPALKSLNINHQEHYTVDQSYQQKVIENILSVINLQYRFCMTSYEKLAMIADSGYNKLDLHDDHAGVYPRMHNLTSSCHGDNSIPCLYPLQNDSLQSSLSGSKVNLERTVGESRDSLCLFPQNQCNENYNCNPRDLSGGLAGKDPLQFDQRNPTFGPLQQNFSLCPDSRFAQFLNGRNINIPNSPYSSESSQSPIGKFLDMRNTRYPDTTRGNIQAKFLSKNIPPSNLQRGLNSPSMSGLQRQAQSAQLRRWSEVAAHGVSERPDDSGNIRRWSVPWDGGQPPLSNSPGYWNDSSKYNSKDKVWIEEQDSLDTAILLLSYRTTHKGSAEKHSTAGEQFHKRQCTTEGATRAYSIWSGSGTFPFLQLSESPE